MHTQLAHDLALRIVQLHADHAPLATIVAAAQAALDAARAEERERCARLAVQKNIAGFTADYRMGWLDGAEDYAAAIRALAE